MLYYFLSATSGYIGPSVGRSVGRLVGRLVGLSIRILKNFKFEFLSSGL